MFKEYLQVFYLGYQNLGDLYIFALPLDTSLCKQSYIIVQIKRFSRKNSELSTQDTQQGYSICTQMNESQQRKPVV